VLDTTFNPPLPIALKLGDVDLDGFPDLLAITVAGRDQTPHLVYSVPCAANLVGCAKDGSGRRGWKLATKGVETLETVKDARSVTFLDMDEDVGFIALSNSIHRMTFSFSFFFFRAPWTSWFNAQDKLVKETFCSSRITSTTTLFSSRP